MRNMSWLYSSNHATFELSNVSFSQVSITTHLVYQNNGYKDEPTTTSLLFVGFIDFVIRKEGEKGSIDDAGPN